MKKIFNILIASLVLLSLSPYSKADLNVFACEPEWASLVEELGGNKVKAYSATTGLQDPHHVQARPSLIAKARKADLLICTGADLEAGWLPVLMKKSGNAKIQKNQPGYFMAAEKVSLLEQLDHVSQSMGDVHKEGNPHIQLDPRRILQVATALQKTMIRLDPANTQHYQAGYQSFQQRWQSAMQGWIKQAAALKGMPIVVHHNSWVYLQDWLGLKMVATLEAKPGVPPSAGHLSRLIETLKQTPAKVTIYSSYQNPKAAKWLEGKTGTPALNLPSTIGGSKQATDLYALFNDIISRLAAAAR